MGPQTSIAIFRDAGFPSLPSFLRIRPFSSLSLALDRRGGRGLGKECSLLKFCQRQVFAKIGCYSLFFESLIYRNMDYNCTQFLFPFFSEALAAVAKKGSLFSFVLRRSCIAKNGRKILLTFPPQKKNGNNTITTGDDSYRKDDDECGGDLDFPVQTTVKKGSRSNFFPRVLFAASRRQLRKSNLPIALPPAQDVLFIFPTALEKKSPGETQVPLF